MMLSISSIAILFGEVSVQVFLPFFLIELFVFLLLSFKGSLCILGYCPLLSVSFANTFS